MVPESPAQAFGSQALALRKLIVEIVRARHNRSAEAHAVSASRYALGFSTQWRDLLDDVREVLESRGFRTCTLAPGGHKIPIINDSMAYVWRVPSHPDAVSKFASSPTRKNSFTMQPPDPALWEPKLSERQETSDEDSGKDELVSLVEAAENVMPLVLVMVKSVPRQLQSIEWAVAVLGDEGRVELRGHEVIWKPEPLDDSGVPDIESFDSGDPVEPKIEPIGEEGSGPDA